MYHTGNIKGLSCRNVIILTRVVLQTVVARMACRVLRHCQRNGTPRSILSSFQDLLQSELIFFFRKLM